ncbi:MAG: hypothetical protein SOR61_02940 [Evtepia sp.]|uniref:hypothetical protein n=1 Tax=Evtepia sp. TaxID=2773933 RepID=UPI002A751EDE|nr:hypothetical protein [Evtepia sp.]MDY3014147.1 hypothetical protein [Evtepia sp.]
MLDQTIQPAEDQTCPSVGYQSASICVPITVTPFARTGATITKCCGDAVVTPGRVVCEGTKNGSCSFTISQDICVAVPVVFGATATEGEAYVACGSATSEDVCSDCSMTMPVDPVEPNEPEAPEMPVEDAR